MAIRDRLLALDETAVAAAHSSACLPAHLPAVPDAGSLIVVDAGKAAASMAVVAEEHYRRPGALAAIGGFAATPYGARDALGNDLTKSTSSRRATPHRMPRALRRSVRFPSSPSPASVTSCSSFCRAGPRRCGRPPPLPSVSAASADTPGGRRAHDAAGATIGATTLVGVRHLDAKNFLHNNDATSFFEAAGGLIVRGPTHTNVSDSNVNDFRIILVDA
jgi:glycerate-2-kinase